MRTTVIACKTIETEVLAVMNKLELEYPILWLESGLHNVPSDLNHRLQELILQVEDGRILLAMGYCGNAIADLRAEKCELIIPRSDDCISLLLGSVEQRQEIAREYAAYFLTDGWLRGERNLWVEYLYTVKKYGEKVAASIAEMMYGHYKTLALLDNHIEPIEELVEKSDIIAKTLHLEQKIFSVTFEWLEQLFTGPWDCERFLIKEPGSSITAKELMATKIQ